MSLIIDMYGVNQERSFSRLRLFEVDVARERE